VAGPRAADEEAGLSIASLQVAAPLPPGQRPNCIRGQNSPNYRDFIVTHGNIFPVVGRYASDRSGGARTLSGRVSVLVGHLARKASCSTASALTGPVRLTLLPLEEAGYLRAGPPLVASAGAINSSNSIVERQVSLPGLSKHPHTGPTDCVTPRSSQPGQNGQAVNSKAWSGVERTPHPEVAPTYGGRHLERPGR